jgi:hypothetical protein
MKWVFKNHVFALVILAQLISLFGLLLVEFGLAIWLYKETASINAYTLSVIFAVLPGVVVVPFAFRLVDRFDLIWLMAAVNVVAAVAAAWLFSKAYAGELVPSYVYLVGALLSVCRSLERIAYLSILSGLLPRDKWGHAGGVVNLASGAIQAFAPIAATALLSVTGVTSLLGIEIATFVFAALVLARVRAMIGARDPRSEDDGGIQIGLVGAACAAGTTRDVGDVCATWRFVMRLPKVGWMLSFFFVFNVLIGVAFLCVTPIVLSLHSEATLSGVLVAAGIGALAGGLVVSWRGVPARVENGIFGPAVLVGLLVFASGFVTEAAAFCALTFGVMCLVPLINASEEYFWLSRIPSEMHGRIFSIREVIASVSFPIGAALIELSFGMLPRGGQADEVLTVVDNVGGLRMAFVLAGGALAAAGWFAIRWVRIPDEFK